MSDTVVIPAQAGIQKIKAHIVQTTLDSRLRGSDENTYSVTVKLEKLLGEV